ncbi:MAG: redoxin domain-containing protein [Anditalea sp.]
MVKFTIEPAYLRTLEKLTMKKILIIISAFLISFTGFSQRVDNFELQDVVTGKKFSLSNYQSATAIVLIFTTNTCPFSKLYEDRIIELANQFGNDNFQFALVNPHAGTIDGESVAEMINKGQTKMHNLPYLADPNQELTQSFGITKIPEAVVITSGPTGFAIAYRGAIDNNPQLPHSATKNYLENALVHASEKKMTSPASTRPVGCNVRLIH